MESSHREIAHAVFTGIDEQAELEASVAIRVGNESISRSQARYLKEAREAPAEGKARLLLEVLSDNDIKTGRESLSPDWVEVYNSIRGRISRSLPRDYANRIERQMSKIMRDDTLVAEIDPRAMSIAFLLGAGASKPKPSDIPTVKELLPDLLSRARRLDRADLQKLADFCDDARIDNIEDLLTAAQLSEFCSRNASILRLVEYLIYRRQSEAMEGTFLRDRGAALGDPSAMAFLQDTLQMLFGLLSSRMLPAQPNAGHIAIAKFVQSHPPSAIITTNYDCCMDLALSGQSAAFSYFLDFANQKTAPGIPEKTTSLIKLHGSLNWFYCEVCQQIHLIDIKKIVKEYLNDENCYSVVAVCKDCGGQRRGLLVPPLAMKFDVAPPLTPLIGRAQDIFGQADLIIVVGFSFADADVYISRMLTKSVQTSNLVKIVVFDPDYSVAQKLRRQLSLRIADFDENRVISVVGDCASTLPRFLEGGMVRTEDPQKRDADQVDTGPPFPSHNIHID